MGKNIKKNIETTNIEHRGVNSHGVFWFTVLVKCLRTASNCSAFICLVPNMSVTAYKSTFEYVINNSKENII